MSGEPVEELEEFEIGDSKKTIRVGSQLPREQKDMLVEFLRRNADVFAWSHEDMPGVEPSVITHRLNVDPSHRPVKQKRRSFAPERNQAVAAEVEKLLQAGFIREVDYPEWLANVVLVKKSNGKWRMCVDFTDLNKACPKDSFPLPRIDLLVDSTSGHELLSFMDAFSGYNQIHMHEVDQEKTSFITDRGLYCYKMMPFGLKNAGATYQRLVNKMFREQIGRNVEVYVDDMLVKSIRSKSHVEDLTETFETLRRYQMKLNPAKCAFGVASGKFLGFMVSQRGIEANPEKIQAVLDMHPPRTTKQLQQLTGRIAALNRFISRSTDKCLPFFKILRKAFIWGEECEEAFERLKEYLSNPPLLSRATEGEILYLYLAVSPSAVSSALIREDSGVQRPVYFTSKALHGAEERYPRLEKLAFALVVSARRLRPYFQAHAIRVLTEYPMKKVLQKPDISGRLINWAIELGEFDIEFHPRTSIKGQAMADFLVEFCNVPESEELPGGETWVVYVDGSSTNARSGAGIVLISPEKEEQEFALKMDFPTTNNEAEYEAVLAGLGIAKNLGAKNLEVRSDSQVIVGHIQGDYEARGEKMIKYLAKIQEHRADFDRMVLTKIPREENVKADALARIGSGSDEEIDASKHKVRVLTKPSIIENNDMMHINTEDPSPEWAKEIIQYLKDGNLPEDKKEARKVRMRAARYTLSGDTLYKRGYTLPLLKCLSKSEGEYVLREIHEGICGSHMGSRMLAHKAVRAGYYWPKMNGDSAALVRHCDKCQRFARDEKSPPEELSPISSPWPFAKWGVDIVGPLPLGKGSCKFLVVAVDYFTKWAEAEALATITTGNIKAFLWKSIVCRYGIPYAFVTDNGKQFDCDPFKKWCAKLQIRNFFSSPGHPQANGQVEATNKTLMKILKKKLTEKKGAWVEFIPEVLWSYRTTTRTPTGETPYSLTFGTEAVIPAEIGSPSFRVSHYNPGLNDVGINLHLDLLPEKREEATVRMAAYQQKSAQYFNKKVRPRSFKLGDWVLRRVTIATKNPTEGKLGPTWEGPYQVIQNHRQGAYHLQTAKGKRLPRPWNAEHLKKYFP
jgi:ribonuclease HI